MTSKLKVLALCGLLLASSVYAEDYNDTMQVGATLSPNTASCTYTTPDPVHFDLEVGQGDAQESLDFSVTCTGGTALVAVGWDNVGLAFPVYAQLIGSGSALGATLDVERNNSSVFVSEGNGVLEEVSFPLFVREAQIANAPIGTYAGDITITFIYETF